MEKKSFLLYHENYEQLKLLSMEQRGQLLTSIYEYETTGTVLPMEGLVEMCFSFIRQKLDNNRKVYEERCEKNRENGKKGGRPKKQGESAETDGFLEKPKKADTDIDTDTVTDTDTDTDTDTEGKSLSLLPPKGEVCVRDETNPLFERCWAAYPKKEARLSAQKAWNSLNPDENLTEKICKAIAAQAKSSRWKTEQGRYIPYPAKWLTDRRWEDEPVKLPDMSDRTYDIEAFDDFTFQTEDWDFNR